MPFDLTLNVQVHRDAEGRVRAIEHLQQPFLSTAFARPNPREVASSYLREVSGIFEFTMDILDRAPEETITDAGAELRLGAENRTLETTVVSYAQTQFALPIWEAGISVVTVDNPLRVTSSSSTLHYGVNVRKPNPNARFLPKNIDLAALQSLLAGPSLAGQGAPNPGPPRVRRINSKRLRILRYDPSLRFDPESRPERTETQFQSAPPTLPLPPVPGDILPQTHYVVAEVLFALDLAGFGELNWRALVEVESGAVLYLRAFIACGTGYVYEVDPVTAGSPVSAGAGDGPLNPLRALVTLPGLTAGNPQALTGTYIQLNDFSPPNVAPPTEASGNFLYNVSTDNFSAVNAYFHADSMFRLVQGLGFDPTTYFSGTNAQPGFPVPVDHRATVFGCSDCVNAAANGNNNGDGLGSFIFALEKPGTSVGIADDPRVVAHEFGHAILWNRVHSPNFGFAHSMGDSLAVIIGDPGSLAADRFDSFPWVTLSAGFGRRHDRPVGAGWAWGGANDAGGYNSEQILSTTHFRIYQSTGGDDTRLDRKQLASRYMLYLIVRAAASLGPSVITPTPTPGIWATALINADTGSANFEGQPGGAFNKVIRWGFEKQGLYQPPGAPVPVTTEGAPPAVDVYIDDGRGGQYPYLQGFWNNTNIWNRLAADNNPAHQTPVVGVPNFAYVLVNNRGTQTANNVVVHGYHCQPAAGLTWPTDWQAMDTPQLAAPGPIPSGGQVMVGPFQWTPTEIGHECMLMSATADGDLSNIDPASTLPCNAGPTPHWRLVPYDNNIGQRNVAPVAGGGGFKALVKSFEGRTFLVRNPFDQVATISIEVEMPEFLRRRDWRVRFANPGGSRVTLGPRANQEVHPRLVPGADFEPSDAKAAGAHNLIVMSAVSGGAVLGGVSYAVDPLLKEPPPEKPHRDGDDDDEDDEDDEDEK